jgi:hypothetical protein
VTIKLLATEKNGIFCFTWARSDCEIRRDREPIQKFEVRTGKNTAFDKAMEPNASMPFFFHSGDLRNTPNYENQRQGWERLYLSTIVVPIQYARRSEDKEKDENAVLGFLCVDTLSPNRLNSTYHVQYMAGFADQMYNFICIMRGDYSLKSKNDGASSEVI